jgi:hypothetical protein
MTRKDFRQLKPGTKVRIVDKRTEYMDPSGEMDHWLGKIMTVREIVFENTGCSVKMVEDIDEFEGDGWYWDAEMIAHEVAANTEYNINISICGNKITASHGEKIGVAMCSPDDSFDELKGVLIAVARMCGYNLYSERRNKYFDYAIFNKSLDDKKSESNYELLPWKKAVEATAGTIYYKNDAIWSITKKYWENIRSACTIVKCDYGEKFEVTDKYGYTWTVPACCVRKTWREQ